jgi:hypothetical protein
MNNKINNFNLSNFQLNKEKQSNTRKNSNHLNSNKMPNFDFVNNSESPFGSFVPSHLGKDIFYANLNFNFLIS